MKGDPYTARGVMNSKTTTITTPTFHRRIKVGGSAGDWPN